MHSTIDNTIMIDKAILREIQTCLQNAHDKIKFLQLESQLQQDDLQNKRYNPIPFLVKKNPLFNIEIDSHQQQEAIDVLPISRGDVHVDA